MGSFIEKNKDVAILPDNIETHGNPLPYKDIIDFIKSDSYIITRHAKNRMIERRISTAQLEEAILSGKVIESYEDDRPCPSFLLLSTAKDISLHIVIGMCRDHVRIITCYCPDENEWINYQERR